MQKISMNSKWSVKRHHKLKTKFKTTELCQFSQFEIIEAFDFLKSYVKNDCDIHGWKSKDTETGYIAYDEDSIKCFYVVEEI